MRRGAHFAITPAQRETLLSFADDEGRWDYVRSVIEVEWDRKHLQETDKAWDPIHRCLTEHPPGVEELDPDAGTPPLNLCIMGGRQLMEDEYDYIIRLIEPEQVSPLAEAMWPLDEEWFARKYRVHCKDAWPEYGEEHCGYAWAYFEDLKYFFRRMAPRGRPIIFTVAL
ncbi:MAG: DUF1877 family protein [Alphaproteobacteria bacterium]|nr:DUF1877 family protein [Alphaproteobacteria bacterium]